MFKDLITYELAEGITFDHLKTVAEKVHKDWMKNQQGFLGWEINENQNGSYTDIVSWESKAHADASNEKMANMPHGAEWMACYKMETISAVKLLSKAHF